MTFDEQLELARQLSSEQAKALIRQIVGTPGFAGVLALLLAHREAAVQDAPRCLGDAARLNAAVGAYSQLDATLDTLRSMAQPDPPPSSASGAA